MKFFFSSKWPTTEKFIKNFHVNDTCFLSTKEFSKMKYRKFFSVPIFAVFLLIGFVYCMTVFIFIEDWVGLQSSVGSLNAMIFSFLASLCLFSFFVGVLTDPGHIPFSYLPDVEDSSVSDQESKKNGIQSKYCNKCAAYKPPRAHHCRVCRRCILMMDHHCLWINNCVGYWNYKAFFTLILYATMSSIHSTVIVISCSCQKDWNYRATPLKIFYYYEGARAAWLAKKSGQSYRHPFDHSVYKNVTLVLGPNALRWLWPTSISHLKDGVSFPTSCDGS
ncbi:probable protein S-acyltransferase 15 isoform X2 [Durio zibethinus]|uniref:S-acyltransferase n=1 Tax=Durio zibethinus TaxID=66656 RepID=A0A6P5YR86_DURZI|nr:probable protein S-acyltransferase 15 isoform X2 [Durio zibethinus]